MDRSRLAVFGTAAFRAAATSALFYAVLTAIMLAIVYPLVASQINARIKAGLRIESAALATLYQARGTDGLAQVISARSSEILPVNDDDADDPGRRYYALAAPDGHILAGDLAHWPVATPENGWIHFRLNGQRVRGFETTLADGQKLLVGQSLAPPDVLGRQAVLVVVIGAVIALLAGLAGGILVGTNVLRRIRRAGRTAARIQAGQLSERLPRGGSSEEDMLARAFNAMLDRIESAVLGLRNLASQTAHEVRHPLARMDRSLARAETASSLREAQADVHKARGEIAELTRRTEALLRLARLENESERREFFRKLNLADLMGDMTDLYAPAAAERGLTLRIDAAQPGRCMGDVQLLAQALANLLDNALRYATSDSVIAVRIMERQGETIAEIENATTNRAEATFNVRQAGAGSGLGLAIVRAIVQLHQGKLDINDAMGRFTVRLTLPAMSENADRR